MATLGSTSGTAYSTESAFGKTSLQHAEPTSRPFIPAASRNMVPRKRGITWRCCSSITMVARGHVRLCPFCGRPPEMVTILKLAGSCELPRTRRRRAPAGADVAFASGSAHRSHVPSTALRGDVGSLFEEPAAQQAHEADKRALSAKPPACS